MQIVRDAYGLVPWLSRAALFLGAVAVVAGILIEHPLMYRGGAVQYSSQAIAIAQRTCYADEPNMKDERYWWRAELRRELFASEYLWNAGFRTREGGFCLVVIDPQNGKVESTYVGSGGSM
jgi:hypothetical protein